jgi:hypothetical protein
MTPRQQVLQKLGFRTDPFDPDIDPDGAPVPPVVWRRALDPRAIPQQAHWLMRFYFDLYEWSGAKFAEEHLIGPLRPDGSLKTFPARTDPTDHSSLLILISSKEGQTGRTALANLILHTIATTEGATPLVVQTQFTGLNKEQNVREMAKLFITTLLAKCPAAAVLKAELWALYDREVKEPNASKDAVYASLFSSLRIMIEDVCTQPIVFLVSGGDDYDVWACIFNSTAALADYVIVQTNKPDAADTCKKLLGTKKVAHVKAPALNEQRARAFLSSRLALLRAPALPATLPDNLEPFTTEALAVLYERGTAVPEDTPVQPRAVGWLRETLRRALSEHIDQLEQLVKDKGAAELDKSDPAALRIDRQDILNLRKKMNSGQ